MSEPDVLASEGIEAVRGVVPVLTGERVRLRAPRDDDAAGLREICRDPESQRWIALPTDYSDDDARHWIHQTAATGWAEGREHNFVIADLDSDALLGTIGLHAFRGTTAEVGVNMGPQSRGRGIGVESGKLIVAYAGIGLGLQDLYWRAFAGNDASRALAQRLGFVFQAELPKFGELRGEAIDQWLFHRSVSN